MSAPVTTQDGLWYCYNKQAWIRDGIVLPCGHADRGLARMGLKPGCYACDHAGERHVPCVSCH